MGRSRAKTSHSYRVRLLIKVYVAERLSIGHFSQQSSTFYAYVSRVADRRLPIILTYERTQLKNERFEVESVISVGDCDQTEILVSTYSCTFDSSSGPGRLCGPVQTH